MNIVNKRIKKQLCECLKKNESLTHQVKFLKSQSGENNDAEITDLNNQIAILNNDVNELTNLLSTANKTITSLNSVGFYTLGQTFLAPTGTFSKMATSKDLKVGDYVKSSANNTLVKITGYNSSNLQYSYKHVTFVNAS